MPVVSIVEDHFCPRFSKTWDKNCNLQWRIARVAGNTLIVGAGTISFLAFPQYTLVSFIAGAAAKDSVRHIIISNWTMMRTVSLVCRAVLGLFAFVSWPYLYLLLPIFIGSFMAFHAINNPDGTKSYFKNEDETG